MEAVIYTASDLQSSKRRIILDQARSGCAEIRDKDGTGLVLVRKSNFVLLRSVREWFSKFVTVLAAFERPTSERRPTDFGELSWLSEFDEEDRQVFRKELLEALNRSLSLDSFEPVENLIRDWRTTASALSNQRAFKPRGSARSHIARRPALRVHRGRAARRFACSGSG